MSDDPSTNESTRVQIGHKDGQVVINIAGTSAIPANYLRFTPEQARKVAHTLLVSAARAAPPAMTNSSCSDVGNQNGFGCPHCRQWEVHDHPVICEEHGEHHELICCACGSPFISFEPLTHETDADDENEPASEPTRQ